MTAVVCRLVMASSGEYVYADEHYRPIADKPTVGDKAQTRPTQQELERLARKFPSKKDRKS